MPPGFGGRSVLTLESRRSVEQATLIETFDGRPVVAPSLREVPLSSQTAAVAFIRAITATGYDCVILLTGVGLRALLAVAEGIGETGAFVDGLRRVRVVARGPKPTAVLREIGVTAWAVAPEPNTWRELLAAIDEKRPEFSIGRARVAVQEYGVTNPDLLRGLAERGAVVTSVPIYQWALPEDLGPLQKAVTSIVAGEIDVVLLTSGVQLAHLYQVARDMGADAGMTRGLARTVIASIGPTCSEEIRRHGLTPDLEASHPKMGILVTEAAAQAGALLAAKRPG